MQPSTLTLEQTARWTRIGRLAALAMALSYLETFIPIPIPGVKLGLANIAVLIALTQNDVPGALYVGLLKVLSLGLLFGNPVSMSYSLVGTMLAFVIMAPLSQVRNLSLVLVSVCGALAHEAGQLVVAMVLLGTPLVWYSAPLLFLAGSITGCACGMIAKQAASLLQETPAATPVATPASTPAATPVATPALTGTKTPKTAQAMRRTTRPFVRVDARIVVGLFAVFTIVALHAPTPPVLLTLLGFAGLACILGRVPARTIGRTLAGTATILVITFFAQAATLQTGAVVFLLGPLPITEDALSQTAIMTARLLAVVAASVAVMHLAPPADLVDALSWALAPLRKRGLATDGAVFALEVALSSVPTLVELAGKRTHGWRNWRTEFPAFIVEVLS